MHASPAEHTESAVMHGELDSQQRELQEAAIAFARTSLSGSRIRADRDEIFDR